MHRQRRQPRTPMSTGPGGAPSHTTVTIAPALGSCYPAAPPSRAVPRRRGAPLRYGARPPTAAGRPERLSDAARPRPGRAGPRGPQGTRPGVGGRKPALPARRRSATPNAVTFLVLFAYAGRLPVASQARDRGRVPAPPTYLPVGNRRCGQELNGITATPPGPGRADPRGPGSGANRVGFRETALPLPVAFAKAVEQPRPGGGPRRPALFSRKRGAPPARRRPGAAVLFSRKQCSNPGLVTGHVGRVVFAKAV